MVLTERSVRGASGFEFRRLAPIVAIVVLLGAALFLGTPPGSRDGRSGATNDLAPAVSALYPNLGTNPPYLQGLSLADDPAGPYLLAFGGSTPWEPTSDYTLAFENGAWLNLTPDLSRLPPPRFAGSMAYDPVDREVVLFGGCQTSSCYPALGDTWVFSNGTWSLLTFPGGSPSPRGYAALAWDYADSELVLFGGESGTPSSSTVYLNDTWIFVHNAWTNETASLSGPSPPARAGAGIASAPAIPLTLFGGIGATLYADTWTYAGLKWTNVTSSVGSPPSPRHNFGFAGDTASGTLVLFGGFASGQYLSDTWTLAGGRWARSGASGPPGSTLAGFAWDSEAGYFVLYGGAILQSGQTGTTNAVWTFQGTTWTLTNPAPAKPFDWFVLLLPLALICIFAVEFWYLSRRTRRQLKQLSDLVPEPPAGSVQWVPTMPASLIGYNSRRMAVLMYAIILPMGILLLAVGVAAVGGGILGVLPFVAIFAFLVLIPLFMIFTQRNVQTRAIGIFDGGVIVERTRLRLRIPWGYLQPPNAAPKGPFLFFHYSMPGRQQMAGGFSTTYDQARAILRHPAAAGWALAPPVRAALEGTVPGGALPASTGPLPSGGLEIPSAPPPPPAPPVVRPPPSAPAAPYSYAPASSVPPTAWPSAPAAPAPPPAGPVAQVRRCPRCGSLATMSMRFCPHCGGPLF